MTDDEARELLTITVLDRQDVRDGFKLGTYRGLLTRAQAVLGMKAATCTEQAAQKILRRAHDVAISRGVYNNPLVPAQGAADVIMRAAKGRTAR